MELYVFETNPQFSFQIIDVLLGGTGDRNTVSKEFSDIDKNIMMQITSGMIYNLKLAWEDILSVEPEVEMRNKSSYKSNISTN